MFRARATDIAAPAEPAPLASENEPLRLHLNESPYGCSLLVQESLSIYDSFAQQPGPVSRTLMRGLCRYAGRPADDLYLANSPRELLGRVLRVLVEPGDSVIAYAPHTRLIGDAASDAGVLVTDAPREDGQLAAASALRLRTTSACTVFLGSPNDPTGEAVRPLEVVSLLRAGVTVIADETYAEYTDKGLSILGGEFPNLVSLRSFAPWAGLWGIPVSYAVASPELVARLEERWPQSSLTAASRIAAGASLDDAAMLLNGVKHVRLERARLFRRLRKLNFVQPLPSHGPFLLCEVTRGDAACVCRLLAAEGVLIHDAAEDGMPGYVRISVGTSAQTDQLFGAMCRISVSL